MYIKVSHSSPNKSIFEEKFHGQYHFFYFTMKVCGSGCNAASGNLWTMKEIYGSIQWVMSIDNSGYSVNEPWNVWPYAWVVMSYFYQSNLYMNSWEWVEIQWTMKCPTEIQGSHDGPRKLLHYTCSCEGSLFLYGTFSVRH